VPTGSYSLHQLLADEQAAAQQKALDSMMVPPSYLIGADFGTKDSSTAIAVWHRWNRTYADWPSASAPAYESTVWSSWNKEYWSSGTSSATTTLPTSDEIWACWSQEWRSRHPYPWPTEEQRRRRGQLEHYQGQGYVRAASAEQRAQWQREEQERSRKYEEEQRKLAEAKQRADELLKAHLTPQQREEFEQHNQFHLLIGDKKYRIRRGRSRNIQLVNEQGAVVKTLCAHPSVMVPDGDCLLAQKLMLETDEQEFLRIANHS